MYSWTLKNSIPEDQTERKNDKSETPKPVGKDTRRKYHPNTGLRDPSKTFPRIRHQAKLRPTFSRRVLNANWRDRVTNAELYGDLPTLSDSIGFKRLGLIGHCHHHRELRASQLVLWRPTRGHLGRGRPVSTLIGTLMRDAGAVSSSELSACMDNWADWAVSSLLLLVDFDLFVFLCFKTR